MEDEEIYFELSDTGNLVKLEPIKLIDYNSKIDWDNNFIKTKITVIGGAFSGQYFADFMTIDFEILKQNLNALYDNLSGFILFENIEHDLQLRIQGDGIGHFGVEVTANDNPGIDSSELNFSMSFDQTQIKPLVIELDKITKKFPITGDFNIKNI